MKVYCNRFLCRHFRDGKCGRKAVHISDTCMDWKEARK